MGTPSRGELSTHPAAQARHEISRESRQEGIFCGLHQEIGIRPPFPGQNQQFGCFVLSSCLLNLPSFPLPIAELLELPRTWQIHLKERPDALGNISGGQQHPLSSKNLQNPSQCRKPPQSCTFAHRHFCHLCQHRNF